MKLIPPAYGPNSLHCGGQQERLVRVEEHSHETHAPTDWLDADDAQLFGDEIERRQGVCRETQHGHSLRFVEPFAIAARLIPSRLHRLAQRLRVDNLRFRARRRAVVDPRYAVAIACSVVARST